jgi:hypothetical protein
MHKTTILVVISSITIDMAGTRKGGFGHLRVLNRSTLVQSFQPTFIISNAYRLAARYAPADHLGWPFAAPAQGPKGQLMTHVELFYLNG